MTPQSSLMVAAEIPREKVAALKCVLERMNSASGRVDEQSPSVLAGKLDTLHFARFTLLDDQTLGDIHLLYGKPVVEYPVYLAFMCDFDGGKEEFLSRLVEVADSGLRKVFSPCRGFQANCDLKQWMREHDLPISAAYINWRGRTVQQTRQERALRLALGPHLRSQPGAFEAESAGRLWLKAREFKKAEEAAGRLALLDPVTVAQKIGELVRVIWYFLLLAVLFLPFLFLVVFFIRPSEETDPVYAPEPSKEHQDELSILEDWQFTNQFTVMGSVKPSLARRLVMRYSFAAIDFAARFFYVRGRLARIRSIHAARWVFLDRRRRAMFASNYDGSLESYMDDFINKTYFGLNLAFSGGMTYPRTKWILAGGAWDEQKFKNVLRRHQLPTQVWYDACPDVTAVERERNARIRAGLEQETITEEAARQWLQLL